MVWLTKPPLGTQPDWTHPLNNGIVGLWLFNEGTGNLVYDLSGNENTGTIDGATWVPGRLGSSLSFNGIDNNIVVPSSSVLRPKAVTFSVGFQRTSSALKYLINWFYLTNSGFGIRFTVGDLIHIFDDLLDAGSSKYPTAADTNYHQIVVVLNGDTGNSVLMYLDGILVGSGSNSLQNLSNMNSATILYFGARRNTDYYSGVIDEVRVWNRELTTTEILNLYISPYDMFIEEGCAPLLCTLNVI